MGYRGIIAPDSYWHVYNRGTKKLPIFRNHDDFWRLLGNLFYFNHDGRSPRNWARNFKRSGNIPDFIWSDKWESRKPLVSVLAFAFMPNHLHFILKEVVQGGMSRFMHRTMMGYSKFLNEKYDESGTLYQGTFKSRPILEDFDFQYLATYVMVKNPFELYPGGINAAIDRFDEAYEYAIQSPFNSLADYAGRRNSPIITKDLLGELFSPGSFKEFSRECMLYKLDQLNAIDHAIRILG